MRLIEPFRKSARGLLPRFLYKGIANITDHVSAAAALGPSNYFRLHASNRNDLASIKVKGNDFYFRPGTPDVAAITQNIARHEWLQSPLKNVKYILDGGAYIGDSTFAFLLKYPKARVICVEPNSDTLPLLKKNLLSIGKDTTLVRGGISNGNKSLRFAGDFLCTTIQTDERTDGEIVHCFDINFLMHKYNIPYFDIVKLDIEGAEKDVLTTNNSWLSKTQRVLVEFHGDEIEQACKAALQSIGFSHFQFRSVHYFDKLQT
jgi:FkbM family methyltransferase